MHRSRNRYKVIRFIAVSICALFLLSSTLVQNVLASVNTLKTSKNPQTPASSPEDKDPLNVFDDNIATIPKAADFCIARRGIVFLGWAWPSDFDSDTLVNCPNHKLVEFESSCIFGCQARVGTAWKGAALFGVVDYYILGCYPNNTKLLQKVNWKPHSVLYRKGGGIGWGVDEWADPFDPDQNPTIVNQTCYQKLEPHEIPAGHNGNPCGYLVCVNGEWRAPAEYSEDNYETCTLSPLFRYEQGDPTLGIQEKGVPTAIGCFPTTAKGVSTAVGRIVAMALGVLAFGVSLASMIGIITQGDNPEKVQESKKRLTTAILGMLFIILSIFLLRFVGINILNLQQFGATELESIGNE